MKNIFFAPFIYVASALEELKKVSWPTKKQVTYYTKMVVIISVLVALFLGFLDGVFGAILDHLIFK